MKSAFGIPIKPAGNDEALMGVAVGGGAIVSFWKEPDGLWRGQLTVNDVRIGEDMGSASIEASYRSLRGRARNLMRGMERLKVKA